MIRRIDRLSESDRAGLTGYYGGKILAAVDAYGTGYEFCRLYRFSGENCGGYIMIYNGSAVIDGKCAEGEELSAFLEMCSPHTIECPRELADGLASECYEKEKRTMFQVKRSECDTENIKKRLSEPFDLVQMYEILSSCFDGIEYDLWYADMSHRIRHGVTKAYVLDGCTCAAAEFTCGRAVYISQTATLAEYRGQGKAAMLLSFIAEEYANQGKECFLWAASGSEGYYRKLGYPHTGEDIYLESIEKTDYEGKI